MWLFLYEQWRRRGEVENKNKILEKYISLQWANTLTVNFTLTLILLLNLICVKVHDVDNAKVMGKFELRTFRIRRCRRIPKILQNMMDFF